MHPKRFSFLLFLIIVVRRLISQNKKKRRRRGEKKEEKLTKTETEMRMTIAMRRQFSNLPTNERSAFDTNNDNDTAIDYY
jgi:hypothetical protein